MSPALRQRSTEGRYVHEVTPAKLAINLEYLRTRSV
jgi:hypothetical protein